MNNVATAPLIVAELQAELSLRESLFRDSATVAASMVLADSVVLLVNDVRFEDNVCFCNAGGLSRDGWLMDACGEHLPR